MKPINACIAIIIAITILSCHKGSESSKTVQNIELGDVALSSTKDKTEEFANTVSGDTVATKFTPPQIVPNAGTPVPDWDKKIIKTADVRLELKDYSSYNTSIHNNLKKFGAYIANEEQTQYEGEIANTMSIKVPVDKFEDLMNTFSGDGIKVVQRRISTMDVTDEVVDTRGRIEAKKQAREKYLEFLKKAKNMKEILEVQSEINSLQEELESGAGRVNYLTHQSAYSTVNLTYYQHNLSGTTYTDNPSFYLKLKEALNNGSSIITSFLLLLVNLWPLVIGAIATWFLVRKWKLVAVRSVKKVE